MNVKKAITIGLLTIATIGLVGCAIVLSKHKEYTPKTLDVYAEYAIEDVTINNQNKVASYTIYGYSAEASQDKINYGFNINYTNNTYTVEVEYLQISKTLGKTLNPIILYPDRTLTTSSNINEYLEKININRSHTNQIQQSKTYITISIDLVTNIDTYTDSYTFTINGITTGAIWTPGTIESIDIDNNIAEIQTEYASGYTTGYQAKGDLTDGNFLSIRNMMLSVLTMPFTFINQAFNVTLWEGTAYAFNIGNFIKGVIAIASILFIIRLFTSGFSLIGNYAEDHRARNDTHKLRQAQTQKAKAETRRTNKLADKGK